MLRTYKCEHCGYEKTYLAVTNYPLPCPTGCGATIMRKDITAHQNECSHARISCPNGCGTIIMRKNVTSHQNECSHAKTDCPKIIMRKDASAHQNECPNAKLMECPDCGAVGILRGNHECIELRPPENNVRLIPSN